jgi:hypothetical protein
MRSAQTPPTITKTAKLSVLAAITIPRVVALPPVSIMTIATAIGSAPPPTDIKVVERKTLRKSLCEKTPPG